MGSYFLRRGDTKTIEIRVRSGTGYTVEAYTYRESSSTPSILTYASEAGVEVLPEQSSELVLQPRSFDFSPTGPESVVSSEEYELTLEVHGGTIFTWCVGTLGDDPYAVQNEYPSWTTRFTSESSGRRGR